MIPMDIIECLDSLGRSRFSRWFNALDPFAAVKVQTALFRLAHGNWSNSKSVGAGVFEVRIDFGPGYRVYFGIDQGQIIILLGGGTKKRQAHDTAAAKFAWFHYKANIKESG